MAKESGEVNNFYYHDIFYSVFTLCGKRYIDIPKQTRKGLTELGANMRLLDDIGNQSPEEVITKLFESFEKPSNIGDKSFWTPGNSERIAKLLNFDNDEIFKTLLKEFLSKEEIKLAIFTTKIDFLPNRAIHYFLKNGLKHKASLSSISLLARKPDNSENLEKTPQQANFLLSSIIHHFLKIRFKK